MKRDKNSWVKKREIPAFAGMTAETRRRQRQDGRRDETKEETKKRERTGFEGRTARNARTAGAGSATKKGD